MTGGTIWKGFIHFGETDIPVKLHSAVREERIQFHLLHKRDLVRLHQQMICIYEKKPVPAEAQARGYEIEEGKFIIVAAEELEQTLPESSRMIEVHEFVDNASIDPVFLERVYYLEPDALSEGYGALASALEEMGTAGICTWTMRKRAYLGALQVRNGTMRLSTLRHADELVSVESLALPEIPLSEKELKIAGDLIGQMTAPFEPRKFINEHEQKLRELIEKKARGEKIALLRPKRLKPTAPDRLLAALEASLKKAA
ncbi:MAG TPA: Ku protein [Geobacteraceae bacterium]